MCGPKGHATVNRDWPGSFAWESFVRFQEMGSQIHSQKATPLPCMLPSSPSRPQSCDYVDLCLPYHCVLYHAQAHSADQSSPRELLKWSMVGSTSSSQERNPGWAEEVCTKATSSRLHQGNIAPANWCSVNICTHISIVHIHILYICVYIYMS